MSKTASKTVSVTFNTVTPESAAFGDFDDAGFLTRDEPLDADTVREDGIAAAVAEVVESAIGGFDARAAFEDAGNGTDVRSADASVNPRTGESTSYDVHLNGDGWTDHERATVAEFLTGRA